MTENIFKIVAYNKVLTIAWADIQLIGTALALMINMIHERATDLRNEKQETDKVCCSCGASIKIDDIYYALCVHMEMWDPVEEQIVILEMDHLEFKCRLCAEDTFGRC